MRNFPTTRSIPSTDKEMEPSCGGAPTAHTSSWCATTWSSDSRCPILRPGARERPVDGPARRSVVLGLSGHHRLDRFSVVRISRRREPDGTSANRVWIRQRRPSSNTGGRTPITVERRPTCRRDNDCGRSPAAPSRGLRQRRLALTNSESNRGDHEPDDHHRTEEKDQSTADVGAAHAGS